MYRAYGTNEGRNTAIYVSIVIFFMFSYQIANLYFCVYYKSAFASTKYAAHENITSVIAEAGSDIIYKEKMRVLIPNSVGLGHQCHAVAYQPEAPEPLEMTNIPAKICFSCSNGSQRRPCFEAISGKNKAHQFVDMHMYKSFKNLQIIDIINDKEILKAILFVPTAFHGGSGWSSLITIWSYDRTTSRIINIFPETTIGKSDEIKLILLLNSESETLVVIARYAPRPNDTYADLSSYDIEIYKYIINDKRFNILDGGQYRTIKKYPFKLENHGTNEVIDDQIENIMKVMENME